MERLIVTWCPALLAEGERGEEARTFLQVLDVLETFCPWVEPARLGVATLPARGPARFFGGEPALVGTLHAAVAEVVGGPDGARVGVADGLFAAVLAARSETLVPRGEVRAFLADFSTAVLARPDLAVTLQRLGVRTLGQFADLPAAHVSARFGADAEVCHRVARAEDGELAGLRDPGIARRLRVAGGEVTEGPRQPGFFGGTSAADVRAARAFARVQHRLGTGAVLVGRLAGGRGPADRGRLVPWGSRDAECPERPEHPDHPEPHGPILTRARARTPRRAPAPWPGQVPPPSPVVVAADPPEVELLDAAGRPVSVTGRGLLTGSPARCSIAGGPWQEVAAWAGPWPVTEQWWTARRRRARLQVVLRGDLAALLVVERGRWSMEGLYD